MSTPAVLPVGRPTELRPGRPRRARQPARRARTAPARRRGDGARAQAARLQRRGALGRRRRRRSPTSTRASGSACCRSPTCPTTGSRRRTAREPIVLDDPYRFLPTLGEIDLHLINEGRHEQLWEVLGAHVHHYPGALEPVTGTSFAVWAPSARAVRIKADFNSWDGREHPMRQLGTLRRVGALRARRRQRHGVQVRDPRPRRRVAREGRPDGGLGREARRHGVEDLRVDLRVGRRRLAGRARRALPGRRADERLRDAPRLVEEAPRRPLLVVGRAGRRAAGVRRRAWASPTSS